MTIIVFLYEFNKGDCGGAFHGFSWGGRLSCPGGGDAYCGYAHCVDADCVNAKAAR